MFQRAGAVVEMGFPSRPIGMTFVCGQDLEHALSDGFDKSRYLGRGRGAPQITKPHVM